MITPAVVAWAKPFIETILGMPVEDHEVESILAIGNDEEICKHLAEFSELPNAYIRSTEFVKLYSSRFNKGSEVKDLKMVKVKTRPSIIHKTPSRLVRNIQDATTLVDESTFAGLTVEAPVNVQRVMSKQITCCNCQGTIHDVIKNCINCGRISCSKETSDISCIFCGFGNNSKFDKKCFQEYKAGHGYEAAVETLIKLLSFDKNAHQRTRVLDTQLDFYEQKFNPWNSEAERRNAIQLSQKTDEFHHDPLKMLSTEGMLKTDFQNMKFALSDMQRTFVERHQRDIQAFLEMSSKELKKEVLTRGQDSVRNPEQNMEGVRMDTDFMSPSYKDDDGICLTLHQPWASLVVYGVKRVEGRVWTTKYRGRLWIHAAQAEVDQRCVDELECYYKRLYGPRNCPVMPPCYPTGCLIGCVDLIDVVSSLNGVSKQYPWIHEINDSPFKFILKSPQRLIIPIAMSGDHKLWKLMRPSVYYRNLTHSQFFVEDEDARLPELEMPTAVRSRYLHLRENLLRPLPDTWQACIHVSPDRIINIKNAMTGLVQAFPKNEPCYAELLAAICASIEQGIDQQCNKWSSDTIQNERLYRQYCQNIWSKPNIFITSQVHPLIRQCHQHLCQFAKMYSIGGPHTPPVDIMELHNIQNVPYKIPMIGCPITVIGLAGESILCASHTADEVYVSPGDSVSIGVCDVDIIVSKTEYNRCADEYWALPAILVLRTNLWK